MSKLGRNDPCHCGSGKKFKQCCLAKEHRPIGGDFTRRKLCEIEGKLIVQHLGPYLHEKLPAVVWDEVYAECFEEGVPEYLDKKLVEDIFLVNFALFTWIPEEDFGVENFNSNITLAENYVANYGDRLNSEQRKFIELMVAGYYSDYVIEAVEPGRALHVRDLFLGTEHIVKEVAGTEFLERGDVVLGKILTMHNDSIFVGMFPCKLPAQAQREVIYFKDHLLKHIHRRKITPEIIKLEMEHTLIWHYLDTMDDLYNAPRPTLLNTDGELLVDEKSEFEVKLPIEAVIEILLPMTLETSSDEFIADAQRNDTGEIIAADIPWLKLGNKQHKDWHNTALGHLKLTPGNISLETNSKERTTRGKKELKKLLGTAVKFKATVSQSQEQMFTEAAKRPRAEPKNKEELDPEKLALMQAFSEQHWQNWLDQPIPALNDKTPKQAAKTKKGCEQLEALLMDYEQNHARNPNNFLLFDAAEIRQKLGLK
jgi:hypothetical protein